MSRARSWALAASLWLSAAAAAGAQPAGEPSPLAVTPWTEIPFTRVLRQEYDFSCGSAALASLLNYHFSIPTTEGEVFDAMYAGGDQAQIRRQGFSLLDMQKYLQQRGFRGEGRRMTVEALQTLNNPAITLITTQGYRHFVVIKGAGGGRVLIGDPALGARVFTSAQFKAIWSGVVFVVQADGVSPRFNAAEDWSTKMSANPGTAKDWEIETLTRDLTPLYQISAPNPGLNP